MQLKTRCRGSLQTCLLAWHIARHYLFSRERQALEWMVTIISIAGVAVGVGTIIAVFGVIDGMKDQVITNITSTMPSLSLHHPNWLKEDPDPAILKMLRAQPGVLLAEPVLFQSAMVNYGPGQNQYVQVHATEGVRRSNFFNIELPPGTDALRPQPGKILLSSGLTTEPLAGREVTLISEATIKTALYPVPKRKHLVVQELFKIGNRRFGDYLAFATWADVRSLSLRKKGVGGIYVKLADPMQANELKAELLKKLPQGTRITSWIDEFEEMFTDVKIIRIGMLLVMLMTMLVAALNIIGTLTLIVIQKTREIGILKAMGASRRLVGRIFLAEGALVGVIGSLLGIAMGVAFCLLVKLYKVPMPGGMFRMREIPVQLSAATVALTAVSAVAICTLAALAPAWRAGGLNPVEALRHE